MFLNMWFKSLQRKKGGKDQESIQSSTTPDPGYHMGKFVYFNGNLHCCNGCHHEATWSHWKCYVRGSGLGVWYSLFIKKLAHYSSHSNFGSFIKIRPIIH